MARGFIGFGVFKTGAGKAIFAHGFFNFGNIGRIFLATNSLCSHTNTSLARVHKPAALFFVIGCWVFICGLGTAEFVCEACRVCVRGLPSLCATKSFVAIFVLRMFC